MEELDQGSLHPSIKHPETDMSRPGFEPPAAYTAGGHYTKELSRHMSNLYLRAGDVCSAGVPVGAGRQPRLHHNKLD
jgi:hypothetical protein